MRRVLNWDCKATTWAIEQVGKPFVWGETDCCSLLVGMWEVMYGEPVVSLPYRSLADAVLFSESVGGVRSVLRDLNCTTLDLIVYANTGDVLVDVKRAGDDPFESVLPVITDKFLFTEPGGLVRLLPLHSAPLAATPYRLPHHG